MCWKPGTRIIPQFYGNHDKALWPLDKSYSKWKLSLFKPWRVSVNELKQRHAGFPKALSIYIFDNMFPPRIRTEILRAQSNVSEVEVAEGSDIVGINDHSPTTVNSINLHNEEAEEIADIALDAAAQDGVAAHDNNEINMEDGLYYALVHDEISSDYSWSNHYVELLCSKLTEYQTEYYRTQIESVLGDENEQLHLFELSTHSPEKASTNGQKFLFFHHLRYKYQLFLFNSGRLQTRPPSQFVYVEGLRGVGKTFVINTIWNMTRIIYNTNRADLASAPTG